MASVCEQEVQMSIQSKTKCKGDHIAEHVGGDVTESEDPNS